MMVTVGGKQYEIDGIAFGTVPVWKLIIQEGKPITHEQFNALPDADKHTLFDYVNQYIKNLQGS